MPSSRQPARRDALRFEWHPAKAASNLRKHGIEFRLAATVFRDRLATSILDQDYRGYEERWLTMGQAGNGQVLVVCHTVWERGDETVIRVISARVSTPRERRQFELDG